MLVPRADWGSQGLRTRARGLAHGPHGARAQEGASLYPALDGDGDDALEDLYASTYPDIEAPQPAHAPEPSAPRFDFDALARDEPSHSAARGTLDMGSASHTAAEPPPAPRAAAPAVDVEVSDPQTAKEPSSVPGQGRALGSRAEG